MKYFIIGLHASGKQEIIDELTELGISCGKLFSNMEAPNPNIYNGCNYELYPNKDVMDIFENGAYVFMQEMQGDKYDGVYKYFEGLSSYTYDNNDVFALSPDQILAISPMALKGEEICFIWLDNTRANRKSRHYNEKRPYNFANRDNIERDGIQSLVKFLYGFERSHVIYFNNEEPSRVSTIIYSIIKHPDLFKLYEKNFN